MSVSLFHQSGTIPTTIRVAYIHTLHIYLSHPRARSRVCIPSHSLVQERQSLQDDPLQFLTDIHVSEDDVYTWKIQMEGPPSPCPYAGGKYTLVIKFPAQYPFKPPTITFLTKIYHPSISKDGEICAALIGEGWGPTLNVRHCMTVIYETLQSPSADHPLDEEIGALLRDKPKEFDKKARKFTQKYAME